MNAFPDKIGFDYVGVKNNSMIIKLTNSFRYFSSKYGTIKVPVGFLSDGASVPRIFWSIFSPFGEYFKAALIHDYLYTAYNKKFNRATSDKIFLEAMTITGVPFISRQLIYRAVRLGGWASFKGYSKD